MHVKKKKRDFLFYFIYSIESSKGNCFVLGRSQKRCNEKGHKSSRPFVDYVLSTYPPGETPSWWYLKLSVKAMALDSNDLITTFVPLF